MAAEIKTQRRFFLLQPFALAPLGDFRVLDALCSRCSFIKQATLQHIAASLHSVLQRDAQGRQHLRSMGIEPIKRAATNERFHRATIHQPMIKTPAKIKQIAKEAMILANFNEVQNRCLARALNGA